MNMCTDMPCARLSSSSQQPLLSKCLYTPDMQMFLYRVRHPVHLLHPSPRHTASHPRTHAPIRPQMHPCTHPRMHPRTHERTHARMLKWLQLRSMPGREWVSAGHRCAGMCNNMCVGMCNVMCGDVCGGICGDMYARSSEWLVSRRVGVSRIDAC